jgi:hypothetical protein
MTHVVDAASAPRLDGDADQWRESRWRARPGMSRATRVAVCCVPIAAAVTTSAILAQVVARPAGGWAQAAWSAGVFGGSTVVLLLVDRLARRLLPLAVLLRLSLVFPDRAPSRFAVALRAGTTRHLEVRLEEARRAGARAEPAVAAERILELMGALSAHDRISRRHCERVRAFSDLLASEAKLSMADQDRLRWAALLHDIGKLRVPARTLMKAGKPNVGEWQQLRGHPAEGALLTAGLTSWLGPWARTIPEHHEHWNGAGYPNGLLGDEIALGARIVAVADAFEVMTARRPYQRPVSADAARKELARCAGVQFDPAVVRAFLSISIGRLHRAMGPLSWLAELPFVGSLPRPDALAAAAGRSAATATIGVTAILGASAVPGRTVATVTVPAISLARATPTTTITARTPDAKRRPAQGQPPIRTIATTTTTTTTTIGSVPIARPRLHVVPRIRIHRPIPPTPPPPRPGKPPHHPPPTEPPLPTLGPPAPVTPPPPALAPPAPVTPPPPSLGPPTPVTPPTTAKPRPLG